jgi:hypothetical protein
MRIQVVKLQTDTEEEAILPRTTMTKWRLQAGQFSRRTEKNLVVTAPKGHQASSNTINRQHYLPYHDSSSHYH